MSTASIVVMVVVLAGVWGGFALLVLTAMRKERPPGE